MPNDTILPSSLSAIAHIRAFDETFRDKLGELDVAKVLMFLTDHVPESALDTLIAQWGLVGEGLSVANATVAIKRKLLRQAALLNSRRGTIWALRYVFDVAGMPDIEVIEAAELNADRFYDGTWFYSGVIPYGFQWKWAEYAVKIHVSTATASVSSYLLAAMEFVLLAYAPARCNHIGFTLIEPMNEPVSVADDLVVSVF